MANTTPAAGGTPGANGNTMAIDFNIKNDFAKFDELQQQVGMLSRILGDVRNYDVSLSNDDSSVQAWKQREGQYMPLVQQVFDTAQRLLQGTSDKGMAAVTNIAGAEQFNQTIA